MLVRLFMTRCFSVARDASSKLYRARVNTLLFGADRLLLTPRANTLESYLMTRLSDDTFYNTYRSVTFMRLIRFCLERHLFDIALSIHDRMLKEGFIPVHALSLRMTALRLVRQATNPEETLPTLKKLFEKAPYDVPAFMDLVRYLTDDTSASGALIDDLAHAFVAIRQIRLSEYPDLVGELASVNMRAGRLDAAQTWLQSFEDACGTQGISPDVTPYSSIITTLNDIDPKNGEAIQDVLVRMKSAGVSPDASVFNVLIRLNLVQQRYHEAFALYHVLMQKRSEELMPNDVTYKMLFRATHLLDRPRVARRHRPPENVVPPRRLFRDMLECHLEQTQGRPLGRSTVLSVSAIHLALRTFMAREDYAAAFVVVCAMPAFGFRPNLQSYLIVFVSLLHRMKREASLPCPEDAFRFVDFLTHIRPNDDLDLPTLMDRIRQHRCEPASSQHASSSPIGTNTVAHLLSLALGDPTRRSDDDIPHMDVLPPMSSFSPPDAGRPGRRRGRGLAQAQAQVRIPTVAMLTGAEDASESDCFYSPVPLARVMHQALLGELFRKAVRRSADWDWKGAVGPIVEETGREMIPEGVVEGWEMEGKEAKEGREVLPFAAARMRRRRRSARGGREIAFDFES